MEEAAALLHQIAEVDAALAVECRLDSSLQHGVSDMTRRKLKLQLRLVDHLCTSSVSLLHDGKPSWSAHSVSRRPTQSSLDAAMRMVKLAEILIASPAMEAHGAGVRRRAITPALKMRAAFRRAHVHFAASVVHYHRQRPRLALAYSDKCLECLRSAAATDSETKGPSLQVLSLCAEDALQLTQHPSAPSALPGVGMCQAILTMYSSRSVVELHCDQHAAALSTARQTLAVAEVLRDDLFVLQSVVSCQSASAAAVVASAIESCDGLLSLLQYNLAVIVRNVREHTALAAVPHALVRYCTVAEERRLLKCARANAAALRCADDSGDARRCSFLAALSSQLYDCTYSHAASTKHEGRGEQQEAFLHVVAGPSAFASADDTLHEFRRVAGLLSQQRAAVVSAVGRRGVPVAATTNGGPPGSRWIDVPDGATSISQLP